MLVVQLLDRLLIPLDIVESAADGILVDGVAGQFAAHPELGLHTPAVLENTRTYRMLSAANTASSPVGDATFACRGAESARSLLAVANSACPASPGERHQSDQSAGREPICT